MKTSTLVFVCEIALILVGGSFLFFFWTKLPPQMPWFYSLPWGEIQLIPKLWFGVGFLILTTISTVNYFVSEKLDKKDSVAALVVAGASLLLIILYLASFFRVLSIMI
ncbi:hypothetical protein A3A84_00920 [Candidatus Collierbacteria bacterium RIFCSPLOWO2_01_FULL_50_23]|uniref:DUF1648 domain-containing protein n=2 Tax=Candidatus Collieribacteriota TaxID=1752725 RepID=A0A1F5EV67_9BACT|nr:MAG: hypothetical protein A2703_01340 [Candidatus Collierbacteria bacterium RIFCSPHIGHO2_01_FULL_50_25]OGD71275.1 MAG: hypothetical protein A3D09_01740 [Candidatus Collierbacteria bacterium RIFCSPHIGHO2_02_FULL_49_10]OGD74723.1 MAG: hypothetical protein A3A84_00920 [Candidatus Collierbacteria bacterium RIFCSPLOWO2_01_FULL_50_23]